MDPFEIMNDMLGRLVSEIYENTVAPAYNAVVNMAMDFFNGIFTTADPQMAYDAIQYSTLYPIVRSIAVSIMVLIVMFQTMKSMVSFIGIETEEPMKILFRTLLFGVLMWFAGDILKFGVAFTRSVVYSLLQGSAVGLANNALSNVLGVQVTFDKDFNTGLSTLVSIGPSISEAGGTTVSNMNPILNAVIFFHFLGLFIRMASKLLINAVLVTVSPIFFAAAATKATFGYFQGFIRVFIGNLAIQIGQYLCVILLFSYMQGYYGTANWLLQFIIILGVFKISKGLEDLIRDMSMSVGLGRDMGGGVMQKVSSTLMTVSYGRSFFGGK